MLPTLYDIGHVYLKLNEPAQAIPWLERALIGDPKHLAALHQLGVACEQLGRRDEALTWWRRALELDPDYYLARQRLYELGLEPAPSEPPLPPKYAQMAQMAPIVKARMNRPRIFRNGGVTLTYDPLSFVLEDTENPRNATVYSGQPFYTGLVAAKDRCNGWI
jgi:tetratricopeptide (TPR) repeat protein